MAFTGLISKGQGYVIVGLGNPGEKYAGTRHNIGFTVVDVLSEIATTREVELTESAKAISAQVVAGQKVGAGFVPKSDCSLAKVVVDSCEILLVKPMTFMNRSGEPVADLLRFRKIGLDRLVVIHDEIDLPLGAVRIKKGGGEGGHNGLRSISQMCGGRDYIRIRVGVGKPDGDTPAFQGEDGIARWVLSRFSRDEESHVVKSVGVAALASIGVVRKGVSHSQNRYNC